MPRRKHTVGNDDGFTLIEVMIAIIILSVGLLSLAQMIVFATSKNSLSGRVTSTSALAKDQLERLKAAPFYTDPTARARNPALADGGDINATVGGYVTYFDENGTPSGVAGGFYEVRWQIQTVATPLPLEMLRIQIRCLPAGDRPGQFTFIGDARFITYRTANVG